MATFCLLHGAWHEPSCWEPLTKRLEALGHRTTAPDLPLHDPGAGYEQRVRLAIEDPGALGELLDRLARDSLTPQTARSPRMSRTTSSRARS